MVEKKKNPLPVIFFTMFVNALGFGILIPVIPLLLASPGSEFYVLPQGVNISQGYILLGFLTGIFPFMMFLATPILGQLSDKYGRKPLLVFSLMGTVISYLLFAYAVLTKNLPLLFFSRAFDGITGGNISVAQASIADVTAPADRAKNFGLIGGAFGLGFILGPFLGGKLSDPTVVSWFNVATPFWFAAFLAFLNVVFTQFYFSETHQHMRIDLKINWSRSVLNIVHAYSMKKLRVIFLTMFLYMSGFTFFTTFFSVYLINKFHYSQGNIGDFFSYIGLWVVITQVVILRRIAHKFSGQQILRISLLTMAIAILAFFLPSAGWQLLLVVPFFSVSNGLTMANTSALVSASAEPQIQGEILGISASIQALAQSVPPVLSGFIAAKMVPETPIFISALVLFVAWLVFVRFYRAPAAAARV